VPDLLPGRARHSPSQPTISFFLRHMTLSMK
jgi:hypothetical protein